MIATVANIQQPHPLARSRSGDSVRTSTPGRSSATKDSPPATQRCRSGRIARRAHNVTAIAAARSSIGVSRRSSPGSSVARKMTVRTIAAVSPRLRGERGDSDSSHRDRARQDECRVERLSEIDERRQRGLRPARMLNPRSMPRAETSSRSHTTPREPSRGRRARSSPPSPRSSRTGPPFATGELHANGIAVSIAASARKMMTIFKACP